MTWIDWIIAIVMIAAVVGGLRQGFLRSVCSLGGLFFGLVFAAWNYEAVAGFLRPIVRFEAVADLLGFLLIVLAVTALANLLGWLSSRTARSAGLGCLDSLFGALFGFFQGWLMITIAILLAAAFFPQAHWLHKGQLIHHFYGSCHFGAHLSPASLAERIREGLDSLQQQAPAWLHGSGEV